MQTPAVKRVFQGQLATGFAALLLSFALATGMPAAFAMGLTSAVFMILFLGPAHLIQIANIAYARGTDDLFIVAPLFVLMASLAAYSGVAEAAYNAATRWFNRVPGSLAVSSTAACTAFAAVSGSAVATAVTIGLFAIPEMISRLKAISQRWPQSSAGPAFSMPTLS